MTNPLLLLVDDSPDIGFLVKALSARSGVEVESRRGLADGWAFLQERRPDLLLFDMRLVGESGADLCRRVRAEEGLNPLRIALFTNWVLHEDICEGLEAGADLVFSKELLSQVGDWQQRLTEILAWNRGRVWRQLVTWRKDNDLPAPASACLAVYNQALRQALARQISAGLLAVLLKRAVLQTIAHSQPEADPSTWLHTDGTTLNEAQIAASARPESAILLGASLTEQMWCLLGSRDSGFFTAALSPVIPGLKEAMLYP